MKTGTAWLIGYFKELYQKAVEDLEKEKGRGEEDGRLE